MDWESEGILKSDERTTNVKKHEGRSEKRDSDERKDNKRLICAKIFKGTTLRIFLR